MDSHSKDLDKAKDMEKIMVTAVVVTYNRKALLEKVIRSLLKKPRRKSATGYGVWMMMSSLHRRV